MRASWVWFILIAATAASGCGTASYTHDITVVVDDANGRLGPGPLEVSIFDPGMGSSMDWAKKTMGTTGGGTPYAATLSTTRVRTFLSEDLPGQIVAALFIPAYTADGYFVVSIAPDPDAEKTIVAPFVRFDGGSRGSGEVRGGSGRSGEVREGSGGSGEVRGGSGGSRLRQGSGGLAVAPAEAAGEVAPLPVHYTSRPGEEGWHIAMRVEIAAVP